MNVHEAGRPGDPKPKALIQFVSKFVPGPEDIIESHIDPTIYIDPEAEQRRTYEEKRKAFFDWLGEMSRPENTTTESIEEQLKRAFGRPRGIRPNLTGYLPPDDIVGMERLVTTYWGLELLAMSLAFVAGKQRFTTIIPHDLDRDLVRRHSLAGEYALYVMVTSSLYWWSQEGEIDAKERKEYANTISGIFNLQTWHPHPCADYFPQTLNEYHGKYSFCKPGSYDGSDAIKSVRRLLNNKPITVPQQLQQWIEHPRLIGR